MSALTEIFDRINILTKSENDNELMLAVFKESINDALSNKKEDLLNKYNLLKSFIQNIIHEIDTLGTEIKANSDVLISVKHQKLLRTCFQILISLGVSTSLLPGLGISLTKRCISANYIPQITLSDEQKYEILVICTDFLHRSYDIPVLKNIIVTFHLSDYLAALIQLAFAPLKKPGVYPKFTMTEEMYSKYTSDRQKYVQIYEYLVNNCFQPMLMKELLVLQSVTNPVPPVFVKKVIAKELSRRLTSPGGLLSLIRCLIETHDMDTGVEWKKIDMISKITATKHGNMSEEEYLKNIVSQLKQILSLNNVHYLATAISCLITLFEKYCEFEPVLNLVNEVFNKINFDVISEKSNLPGTIILTPQDVEHSIQILHAYSSIVKLELPARLILPNLYTLFLLRIKCTKDETKAKISSVIIKCLESLCAEDIKKITIKFLFGPEKVYNILIEEYNAGLALKCSATPVEHPTDESVMQYMEIFNSVSNNKLVQNLFEACLQIFVDINCIRKSQSREKIINQLENEMELLSLNDKKYAQMLQILGEMTCTDRVIRVLKTNPLIIVNFVESLFLKNIKKTDDECNTIALVLLNTVLSSTSKTENLELRLHNLLPILRKMENNDSEHISILSKESISLITSEYPKPGVSEYEKALSNVYDNLLPVRAHGIMELTKLIDKKDPETISKRHYVFCLFQEQLKDEDSYVYLASINGIASLATHCTSDVINILCKEFLDISIANNDIDTMETQSKVAELRMKIGDIIVKVTKGLGEMAIVHKTTLLNTMLCACRDDDPLIKTSALSNLAEIALVLNYKIGTIIYEVLLCVWSIIESEKAIECRRAAVMVISSLIKGLGKDTLIELKENLLPIYRTLNKLYKDTDEDSVVRLHAQIALEELNEVVKSFLTPELPMDKQFLMLNKNDIVFK